MRWCSTCISRHKSAPCSGQARTSSCRFRSQDSHGMQKGVTCKRQRCELTCSTSCYHALVRVMPGSVQCKCSLVEASLISDGLFFRILCLHSTMAGQGSLQRLIRVRCFARWLPLDDGREHPSGRGLSMSPRAVKALLERCRGHVGHGRRSKPRPGRRSASSKPSRRP